MTKLVTKPIYPPSTAAPPQLFEVRGYSVVLDTDVANLFQVETRSLNQQVQRNARKFDGFAFSSPGKSSRT